MKGVNLFLAQGFEDTEALATCDVLTRAGIKVSLISIDGSPFVTSSHGITVKVEHTLAGTCLEAEGTSCSDVMIFPGGMPGTRNLAACGPLMMAMKEHYSHGGTLAAICAAPGLVLGQLGSALEGVEFTCFDGFEQTPMDFGAVFVPKPAVRSGRIITGRSAGHAIAFGLEIARIIKGERTASEVQHAMMLKTII